MRVLTRAERVGHHTIHTDAWYDNARYFLGFSKGVCIVNRAEALRLLGLDDDATLDEIKTAYKETAQILHPDKFAGNRKLQKRAEEQFKNLQEAYDVLSRGGSGSKARSSAQSSSRSRVVELESKLRGIAAARVQLQQQRDSFIDRRRTGLMLLIGGAVAALFARWRIPWLAGLGGAVAFWGGFDAFTAHRSVGDLTKQINNLNNEKKQILAELEELE